MTTTTCVLDRAAVQLVLCQHIMEMGDEELKGAYQEATGEALEEGHDDEEESPNQSLPSLIEDRIGLEMWLNHMKEVCRQRVTA